MILSILKGIGCVIGILLLLILLYIVLVCIIPVRYEFDGDYHDRFDGSTKFRYLPVGLKILVSYRNEKLQYTIRLFGGVIMTNTDAKISWIGRKLFADAEKEAEGDFVSDVDNDISDIVSVDTVRQSVEQDASGQAFQESVVQQAKESHTEEERQTPKQDNKQSFLQRIRDRIQNVKQRIRRIFRKGQQWDKKKEAILKVYHSQRFAVAKKDVKGYIRQFFHIIKPVKLEGEIHFGFDDPSVTGELLGAMACMLPLYQNYLTICPDFEQACIDGYLRGKGKIYLGALLILLLKILWNKNLIKVTKKVQTIIEA